MTKNRNKRLLIEQVDRKLFPFLASNSSIPPPTGWINSIRTTLGMSMRQLADKLGKKAQTIQAFEKNEASGAITLQSLKDVANAMDMQLVYAIIPKDGTLMDYIDRKAEEKAKDIVARSNTTMILEDQGNDPDRIENSWQELKAELKNEMPKFLWD